MPWEFVRESILCAFEIEGGDLLFLPLLLFSQNHLLGQRRTGAKAGLPPKLCGAVMPANGHVTIYGDLQQQEVMGPQLAKVEFCLGRQGKVGGGQARKKRQVSGRSVGRGLAPAAVGSSEPAFPMCAAQGSATAFCVTSVSTKRGSLGAHKRRLWFWHHCPC